MTDVERLERSQEPIHSSYKKPRDAQHDLMTQAWTAVCAAMSPSAAIYLGARASCAMFQGPALMLPSFPIDGRVNLHLPARANFPFKREPPYRGPWNVFWTECLRCELVRAKVQRLPLNHAVLAFASGGLQHVGRQFCRL
jgi:hypothetical protein